MNFKTLPLIATAAALALPAAASADTLVTPSQGAQNLAAGGGYLVWSTPAPDGGFQLTVRAPDGTVSVPQIPKFETAPDPAVGSGDRENVLQRPLVAVYSRDGDIYQLDLRTGAESKVRRASSDDFEESSPSIEYGRLTFVRRGGNNDGDGVFYLKDGRLRKLSSARPRELAFNGSRVAYQSGRTLLIRRVSGRGRVSRIRVPGGGRASSLVLSRYSLTFVAGGKLFQTPRFGGSSRVDAVDTARESVVQFPASLNSVAHQGSFIRFYLDAEGLKRISAQHVFE